MQTFKLVNNNSGAQKSTLCKNNVVYEFAFHLRDFIFPIIIIINIKCLYFGPQAAHSLVYWLITCRNFNSYLNNAEIFKHSALNKIPFSTWDTILKCVLNFWYAYKTMSIRIKYLKHSSPVQSCSRKLLRKWRHLYDTRIFDLFWILAFQKIIGCSLKNEQSYLPYW